MSSLKIPEPCLRAQPSTERGACTLTADHSVAPLATFEAAKEAGRRFRLVAAVAAVIVFWASAFVAIRLGLAGLSPFSLVTIRLWIASLILGTVMLTRRPSPLRKIRRRHLLPLAVMGLSGAVIYNVALSMGQETVSAGAASLLVNTVPIWTAVFGVAFLRERLRALATAGIGVAFLGSVLVSASLSSISIVTPGALLIVIAAVAQAVYFVVLRAKVAEIGVQAATTITLWAGTLFLLPALPGALRDLGGAKPEATLAALYLGVVPGVGGTLLWAYAMSRVPASRLSSALYLVPPLALLLGWLVLGETPGALALIGGALTLAGVALAARR